MKNVFEFSDYRLFLQHFYETKKSERDYSYRMFSKSAGLGSANYLKLVMSGKKRLTVANIHQFARGLGLSGKDHEYFEALVLQNQAKNKTEKNYYTRRLKSLKVSTPATQSKKKFNELVANWYVPALVLLFEGVLAKDEAKLVTEAQNLFGVSINQIKDTLAILYKNKVINLVDGKYEIEARHLYSEDRKSIDQSHKVFLAAQIKRSLHELEERYRSGAKFFSHVIIIDPEMLSEVISRFQIYLSEVSSLSDDVPGNFLIQINSQIFPIGSNEAKAHD